MKNLRIITLLTALLVVSFSFSSRAENSDLNKLYNNKTDNAYEMIMEADLLLIELALDFQLSSFPLLFDLNRIVMENDLVLEESLEMEDWMLDYQWIESEELFIEEDMEMEVWMERPQNWSMYECGVSNEK